MTIQVGSEAPDFELASSALTPEGKPGKKVRLSDFRGKKNVVLAFYPLDFSPVCTGEHGCFREDFSAFKKADAEVFGVSVDSVWTHLAFKKSLGVDYDLLADFNPKGAVAKQFGLYKEEAGITSRATVVVDKAGKVAFVHEEALGEGRDNKKILEALSKL